MWNVNATPLLTAVAAALGAVGLEAILIANAAAALHGAPVTTIDFDFMFRATPRNLVKLKQFATRLEATILCPYYPVSGLFRVMNDDRICRWTSCPGSTGSSHSIAFARERSRSK